MNQYELSIVSDRNKTAFTYFYLDWRKNVNAVLNYDSFEIISIIIMIKIYQKILQSHMVY